MGIISNDILFSLITILHLAYKFFLYKYVLSGKMITRYMKSGPDISTANIIKSLRSNLSQAVYN